MLDQASGSPESLTEGQKKRAGYWQCHGCRSFRRWGYRLHLNSLIGGLLDYRRVLILGNVLEDGHILHTFLITWRFDLHAPNWLGRVGVFTILTR